MQTETHRTHQAPTLDAGITGANAASGRCADFIRPPSPCECSAETADTTPGSPWLVDIRDVLSSLEDEQMEGNPSEALWAQIFSCRGADILAERIIHASYDRARVATLRALVDLTENEIRRSDKSPADCGRMLDALSVLEIARQWLAFEGTNTMLEHAGRVLADIATEEKRNDSPERHAGDAAAIAYSLVSLHENQGDEILRSVMDLDIRRWFRAVAQLAETRELEGLAVSGERLLNRVFAALDEVAK